MAKLKDTEINGNLHVTEDVQIGDMSVTEKFDELSTNWFDKIYPIGSIYMSVNSTDPSELFGGTWEAWASGRVPVGVYENDSDFNAAEKYGGEKYHTLTTNEMPSHNHGFLDYWNTNFTATGQQRYCVSLNGDGTGVSGVTNSRSYTASTGGNQAHNNMPPYLTCYMWKRIA